MEKYKPINGWTKEKIKQQLLLKNNGTRSARGEICLYISEGGNRCAVGCFIPDTLIDKFVEQEFSADELFMEERMWGIGIKEEEFGELMGAMPLEQKALEELQGVHDTGVYCGELKKATLTNPNLCSENVHVRMLAWVDQFVEGESK